MYKSMICDIKNSKDLINREEIQSYLIHAIKLCNEKYSKYIAAPFQITAGDEWEGLLFLNAPIDQLIEEYKSNLPKYIQFYTGVGIGSLSINNLSLPVNLLDGPAFHIGRLALKYAKKKDLSLVIIKK